MLDISNVLYTRYNWSELQNEEGVFDFSLIDEGIEDCIKYNKKFAFGVMCANTSTEEPYVTPKFVFDKGAKYNLGGSNGKQYIPDWKDETFLKYVDEFTKALGEKYNGNPYIAFIDIRSYGNFGEQHLFGLNGFDESGEKIDVQEYIKQNRIEPEFLKERYIKPYMQAFPDTQLIIPWGEDIFNDVYEELIDEGVSLRRDGICTYTNGLETSSKTYGKLPMIFEYAGDYAGYKENEGKEYFNRKLEEAMQMCKPSYIELDKDWYNDGNQEYCRKLANKIGYYFRLKKATYNKKIEANIPTKMTIEFKNDGITPISENCSVYVGLLDENNKLVRKYKTDINPKDWNPDTLSKEEVSVTFKNIITGNYKIAIGLYKNDEDENPTYLLGSEGKTEDNWYVCGDVEVEGDNIVSLYCWDIDDFNISKLKDEMDYLEINTLYIQRPANDSQIKRLKEIMEFSKKYELDVFLLEGARDWLTEGDMNNVIDVINQANELNKTLDYKFKGVSLDVEFYLTDGYQNAGHDEQVALFRQFTDNTKKCCDYAESLGLKYSMALPVWLNKLSPEILEDLMNYNYDHIAFMNYFKETIMENIDEEVEIAKKHNINIVSIAEVQDPKFGTVGEEDTFYNDGLDQCINTLNEIKQKYNYKNLGISYHYYKPLLSLLERDTDVRIENTYELQVLPYIDETNVKVDKAQISENGNILEPIYVNDSETGKNVVIFYGLEYGKQYELKIESGNYSTTKTFTYQKNDKAFNNLEITNMSVTLEENNPSEDEPGTDNPGENNPSENEPETDIPVEDNPSENEPETDIPVEDNPSENEPGTDNPGENNPSENEPGTDNPGENNPSENEPGTDNPLEDSTNESKTENNKPSINNQSKNTTETNIPSKNNQSIEKASKDNLAPYKIPKTGDNNLLRIILITSIVLIVTTNGFLVYKIHKHNC